MAGCRYGGKMKVLDEIQKTREYLDYIEEHVLNVKRAWGN